MINQLIKPYHVLRLILSSKINWQASYENELLVGHERIIHAYCDQVLCKYISKKTRLNYTRNIYTE